jgi:hypothetical protein
MAKSIKEMSAQEYADYLAAHPDEQKKIDEPQEKLRAEGRSQFTYVNGILVAATNAAPSGRPE